MEVFLLQKETMVEFKQDHQVLVYQLNQQVEAAADLVPKEVTLVVALVLEEQEQL